MSKIITTNKTHTYANLFVARKYRTDNEGDTANRRLLGLFDEELSGCSKSGDIEHNVRDAASRAVARANTYGALPRPSLLDDHMYNSSERRWFANVVEEEINLRVKDKQKNPSSKAQVDLLPRQPSSFEVTYDDFTENKGPFKAFRELGPCIIGTDKQYYSSGHCASVFQRETNPSFYLGDESGQRLWSTYPFRVYTDVKPIAIGEEVVFENKRNSPSNLDALIRLQWSDYGKGDNRHVFSVPDFSDNPMPIFWSSWIDGFPRVTFQGSLPYKEFDLQSLHQFYNQPITRIA